jgi:hypothetical protein
MNSNYVLESDYAYIEVYITWGSDKYNVLKALEIDVISVTTDTEEIDACDMCNEDREMWRATAWDIFLQKYED